MSPSAAKRALETGRRLADQPEVAAAALAGELSVRAGRRRVRRGGRRPGQSRRTDRARPNAARCPSSTTRWPRSKRLPATPRRRRRDRHTKRSLRRWTDRDGAFHAHLYGHPEDGAGLWRMLDPIRRRLNILRRQTGAANDTLDALDYDALMAMAAIATGKHAELALADLVELGLFPQLDTTTPAHRQTRRHHRHPAQPDLFTGADADDDRDRRPLTPPAAPKPARRAKKLAGSPMRVMVRVDLDALLRGVALDGELCEIAGYGPVPVSVVEDLLATENPFIIGILTKAQALVGVYHHGRHPNAHQRSALDFLYPTCAAEGCSSRNGLQYDHRLDYAKTHFTAFDLLDRLCRHHHGKKTHHGWALVEGKGKRAFVPPDDPRHPNHSPSRPATARPAAMTTAQPPGHHPTPQPGRNVHV